jgi:hypothetical protein
MAPIKRKRRSRRAKPIKFCLSELVSIFWDGNVHLNYNPATLKDGSSLYATEAA